VPISSTKRAWIVIAGLLFLILGGLGVYYLTQRRPLPPLPGANHAGPPPDILSQLPPDAPVVAYLDASALRKLQNSPLAAVLGLTSPGPEADREYADFVRDTGFDYTRDLDHAALAFWPSSFGPPDNPLAEDRMLAIADGRFDQQKIKAYALRTGKQITRGSQSIYEVPGSPPISLEFLSATRIAIAGGKGATDLVANISSRAPAARDPEMQSRIQRVAGAPIFAVARTDKLPPSFYAGLRNSPQLERLVRSIRGLTLAGQPEGDNLKMALDAECDSMKSALEISALLDTFRMVGSMAISDAKMRREMTREQAAFLSAIINQLKVAHQDKWVRLSLDITPAMLGAPRSRSASTPATPAPAPAAHPAH
jgi:hypothetical protein